ncbi:glutathione S-transferase T3-like [Raphanus sativus]|uniref:Glutathione S-transferase T3-like n=1 Tax=Raphanus sativus TaxID=3726 RepID=A0A6J0N144_RAPSA|nr:glutathione S-transferase T3-like [Raphanus sativus]XP_018477718.2 glutathione S-transferase T3-like [Raphanus sativus]
MDPRTPYSQSAGYMGLLQSQEGSLLNDNSPYESYHSGSSQIPLFSSQQSEAPTPPTDSPVQRGKRHKWTPVEDEMLISAWLNTSKDPITSNYQKSGTFWKRVGDSFFEALNGGPGGDTSAHRNYKQRWHKINDLVNKFCGAYAAAERRITSGQHENDVLKGAHDIYFADQGYKFTLEHAWCVLRYEQKWLNLNPTGGSKRKADSETSTTSEGVKAAKAVEEAQTRPEGVKAAKARRSAMGKGKSVADYTAVWEMRKEDLDKKEKLSKFAILDSLIAKSKTTTLTEAEEVAKEKLLAEYF